MDLGKEILEYVPQLQLEYLTTQEILSAPAQQIQQIQQIRNKRSSKPGKQLL